MEKKRVTVNTIVIANEMKYQGVTVLTYKIEYPEFQSSAHSISLNLINKFYRKKALEYQKHCRRDLFKAAVEQYKYDIQNGYPVHVYEALVVYQMAYNMACILSLYFDQYEYTGGAHGNTVRYSQTWNWERYNKIKLSQLFRCSLEYKAYIFRRVKAQILKEPDIYFPEYEKLIVETFNEESFYCTPKGIVVYYQQYDIAPYSSGIREFLIPYTDCVINPIKLCSGDYTTFS